MREKVKESVRRGDKEIDPWIIEEEQVEEDAGDITDQIKFNDFLNYYTTKDKSVKKGRTEVKVSPNKELTKKLKSEAYYCTGGDIGKMKG